MNRAQGTVTNALTPEQLEILEWKNIAPKLTLKAEYATIGDKLIKENNARKSDQAGAIVEGKNFFNDNFRLGAAFHMVSRAIA